MARWTLEDLRILSRARTWHEAADQLPHHGRDGVRAKWKQLYGTVRPRREPPRRLAPVTVLVRKSRTPMGPEQQRIAQILSAVYRVAHREQVAVDVTALLDAMGHGAWRWMNGIDWAAKVVVGRDVT
ncbi:hypothetical protein [Sulfobacillus harzensis]|uniref:Uncharacterized protein n=1 Tax=Sulfobacillus harzensis TaxID=2729629 RepID=A0A7Y0Q4N7_9FIRM|nr:hypothetical protein [Sulfobacillus harzensis]NMP24812.1 hypothetical protein [Sulfobacillus harzensis]